MLITATSYIVTFTIPGHQEVGMRVDDLGNEVETFTKILRANGVQSYRVEREHKFLGMDAIDKDEEQALAERTKEMQAVDDG